MPKPEGTDFQLLENKKNEIVQEMVRRIRPFMGPQGQLRLDLDCPALCILMAGETQYLQRPSSSLSSLMLLVLRMPPQFTRRWRPVPRS